MGFLSEHPDYETYRSEQFYVNDLPDNFDDELNGFLYRISQGSANKIRFLTNLIAQALSKPPTQNWSLDYLISDLSSYSNMIYRTGFQYIFDFFELLLDSGADVTLSDVNSFLSQNDIGYQGELFLNKINWLLTDESISKVENINVAIEKTKDICEQAIDCLKKAKENLTTNKNDRDRKDAIFNCLSAMESLLKNITNTSDIDQATKTLRAEKKYGIDLVVKDGSAIFSHIHREYPDIRHGNPVKSVLTDEACSYWIDRINTFIIYICSTYKKIILPNLLKNRLLMIGVFNLRPKFQKGRYYPSLCYSVCRFHQRRLRMGRLQFLLH